MGSAWHPLHLTHGGVRMGRLAVGSEQPALASGGRPACHIRPLRLGLAADASAGRAGDGRWNPHRQSAHRLDNGDGVADAARNRVCSRIIRKTVSHLFHSDRDSVRVWRTDWRRCAATVSQSADPLDGSLGTHQHRCVHVVDRGACDDAFASGSGRPEGRPLPNRGALQRGTAVCDPPPPAE